VGPAGCLGGQVCLSHGEGYGTCFCATDAASPTDSTPIDARPPTDGGDATTSDGGDDTAGDASEGGDAHDGIPVDVDASLDAFEPDALDTAPRDAVTDAVADVSTGDVDVASDVIVGIDAPADGSDAATDGDGAVDGDASPGPCLLNPHTIECATCLLDAPDASACTMGPCRSQYGAVETCGFLEGCCSSCVSCVERWCPTALNAAIDCALANCPTVAAPCM
jgi:hypothetical protein